MYKYFKSRILISIILALLGMFLTYTFLVTAQQKEEIVVPKKDIEPYTKITAEMLEIKKINSKDKEEFYPKAVSSAVKLKGAITRVRLKKNKPIEMTKDNFVLNSKKTMAMNSQGKVVDSFFVPYDKRIMAISVDDAGAVNKRIRSGDFVDIIFTSKDDATGGIYSNMILQHIQVFAVDNNETGSDLSGNTKKMSNVLVLATPEECLKLSVCKRNGSIDLVLNPLNGETKAIGPVNILDFAAEKPMSREEMLDGLEEYIDEQDISEPVKNSLINTLEQERQSQAI
ncbi:MAG: Flp pilus assembly protein CpaB [Aminipila sp.]